VWRDVHDVRRHRRCHGVFDKHTEQIKTNEKPEVPFAPAKVRNDLRQPETILEITNADHKHWCGVTAIFALNPPPNGDPHARMLCSNQEACSLEHGI